MLEVRRGLKILSVCALMCSLIAIMASSANAEWMVNGKNVGSTLQPSLKTELEGGDVLLTKILGIKVEKSCKKAEFINLRLLAAGGTSEGTIKFSECTIKLNEKLSTPCLPKTTGINDVIETQTLVGSLGSPLVTVKPAKAGGFLMVIETSEECAVGQKISVGGTLILKDSQNKLTEELVTHLFEADASSSLTAAGQTATLDGSANASLSGSHAGLKWSGLP